MHEDEYDYDQYAVADEPGWWDPDSGKHLTEIERKKARAASLIDCARNLETAQSEVHQGHLMNAQLYSNRELASFDWGTGHLHRASLAPINRTGENLVLSIVDTLVAQVGKQRPKAKPMPRGASWRLRRQARLLDKFLYGEFTRNRGLGQTVWDFGKKAFRDALIFGFGALYFHLDGSGRVSVERVFPDEILIDQMEVVACGRPRHIYRRRVLPIEVVADTWDCDVKKLRTLAAESEYVEYRQVGKKYIVVVEGWQLKWGGCAGRYMCAVDGMILKEEEWESEHPPFVFIHWMDIDGFYMPSAVEQILPYQIRLNEINEVIRDAQDLMGRPRILVAEGSRVSPMEFDNLVAKIIKYTGIKPEAVNWPAISAELYNERDRQVSMCERQFGVNSTSTAAAAPPNARFDSSPALRELNMIQDDRLADPSQRLEQFYKNVAEQIVRTIDRTGAKPTTMCVTGGKYGFCEKIDWKCIDIDEDSYVLTMEATSVLDHGPSAHRDNLEKQLAMGLISPEDYRLNLAHPDDSAELSLQAAAAADIRRVIELLEEGKWEDPIPAQDLVNGVQTVSLAMLNLSRYEDDDPDDYEGPRLADIKYNFIQWITAARGWLDDGAEEDDADQPILPMGAPPTVPVPEAAGLATQPIA